MEAECRRFRIAVILTNQVCADLQGENSRKRVDILEGIIHEAQRLELDIELIHETCDAPMIGTGFDGYLAFNHPGAALNAPMELIQSPIDVTEGMRTIVKDSLFRGARSPAYIGSTGEGLVDTVQSALVSFDLSVIPGCRIITCKETAEQGYESANLLFRLSQPPDCIYCSSDQIAAGVIAYLKEHHIVIAEDMMVYGFDGPWQQDDVNLNLTTYAYDQRCLGRTAARNIHARLSGGALLQSAAPQGRLITGGTDPDASWEYNREGFLASSRSLGASVSVEHMSMHLQGGVERYGLQTAMDALYQWSLETGYLSREQLEDNQQYSFYDQDYDITYHLQINHARRTYQPRETEVGMPEKAQCAICSEHAGSPTRPLLRILPLVLSKPYFLQLTPFPMFPRHFVLVDRDHIPMHVGTEALRDMFTFLDMAPGYTVCSNSDRPWAGSSILQHMHLQTVRDLALPIFTAEAEPGCSWWHKGLLVQRLHYPIAACRLSSCNKERVIAEAGHIISGWKALQDGNTVNLAVRHHSEAYELYIIFRNPRWRNPVHLKKYKSEGVGIMEVAGHWIFPPPKYERLHGEIQNNGREIITDFFQALNPVPRRRDDELTKLFSFMKLDQD